MSNAEPTEQQLLSQAAAALREKDRARAKPFLVAYSERIIARDKARAANDIE